MATPTDPQPQHPSRFVGDAGEADAWTKAFGAAEPVAPFTEDEKQHLLGLMLYAGEQEDAEGLAQLKELAEDPARYRAFVAAFNADNPEESS
jgi:hypothetical protein